MKVSEEGGELPRVGCAGAQPRVFTLHCSPHLGVFICRGKEDALVTKNLVPGESVYGEKRVSISVRPGSQLMGQPAVWPPCPPPHASCAGQPGCHLNTEGRSPWPPGQSARSSVWPRRQGVPAPPPCPSPSVFQPHRPPCSPPSWLLSPPVSLVGCHLVSLTRPPCTTQSVKSSPHRPPSAL